MRGFTFTLAIIIISILFLGAGAILLQIFLSKKENRWAGLVLPILSFSISVLAVSAVFFFMATELRTADAESVAIAEGAAAHRQSAESGAASTQRIVGAGTVVATAIHVFLLHNIPTTALLAIYAACRGKRNRRRALEKMIVRDLE